MKKRTQNKHAPKEILKQKTPHLKMKCGVNNS